MADESNIGLLGAGRMAQALAGGLLKAGLRKADQMLASDPIEAARSAFATATRVRTTPDNIEVVGFARTLILCIKPSQVSGLLSQIAPAVDSSHLILSIAAGVTLDHLASRLPPRTRLIRAMPNTPAMVGEGAIAFSPGPHVTAADADLARGLFGAIGWAAAVPETMMDAVTGLSGSGPAFVFLMAEALSDGGVASGLPRDLATRLAAQTLAGAARMILSTGQHPGALKDMVTSPGGTTIEGLQVLEQAGVRGALIGAVRAAADKSRRISAGPA